MKCVGYKFNFSQYEIVEIFLEKVILIKKEKKKSTYRRIGNKKEIDFFFWPPCCLKTNLSLL